MITAYGNSIAMEDNLELSLKKIFGGEVELEKEPVPREIAAPQSGKTDRQLAIEALGHYRKSQEYLRQGDWSGYGEELRKMDEILATIEKRP